MYLPFSKIKILVRNFLKFLINSQHPNNRFIVEKPPKLLKFLDVEVQIERNSFNSWIYRKLTDTSLFLNYRAICPNYNGN